MEERIGEEKMELYVTCLHSGSWILSGAFCICGLWLGASWP